MVSFNPKPEAMARRTKGGPHVALAVASGFGLNENLVPIVNAGSISEPFVTPSLSIKATK